MFCDCLKCVSVFLCFVWLVLKRITLLGFFFFFVEMIVFSVLMWSSSYFYDVLELCKFWTMARLGTLRVNRSGTKPTACCHAIALHGIVGFGILCFDDWWLFWFFIVLNYWVLLWFVRFLWFLELWLWVFRVYPLQT